MTPVLHLASASPRRAELLRALGLQFTQRGADLDERRLPGERPADMVLRLAADKANAISHDGVILAADTAVVLGERVFGKPVDEDDAVAMLTALSAQTHTVMTGVAVRHGDSLHTACSQTEVRFRAIDPGEMHRYWQSGEPRDKAGAYAVQGLGGLFVESLSGSYSGVVGLPVYETAELLEQVGVTLLQDHQG
ncbi:MAG: Maf family protein [Pseudomonadota bacterium]